MIVYKYLKKEHLLAFKKKGSILINTLYDLREVEHKPIRDKLEGHHKIKISSNKQSVKLSGKEFHRLIPVLKMNKQQEEKISFEIENGAQFNIQIANAFVFCASLKLDNSLFKRFSYDAYYKITNAYRFADVLFEKINEVRTIRCFKADKVKYRNKEIIVTNKSTNLSKNITDFWDICFTKPKKFHSEKEFRIVFVPEYRKEIKRLILDCPELLKYSVV